jgi:SAM-dependent methyltransferase
MQYYEHDLALIHARGFGEYADRCAPGILDHLARVRGGLVLELGCGAGAMTRHLLAAGHRVIATDASAAMVELARAALGADVDVRQLVLPDDPLPSADAIVSVGHVISYLPDAAAVDRALAAMAGALRRGGVLAFDVCDLELGRIRAGELPVGRAGADWAVIAEFAAPVTDRVVREITTFAPDGAGAWRRGRERHEYVLIDASLIPARLASSGVTATVASAFGTAELPPGLRAVTGVRS